MLTPVAYYQQIRLLNEQVLAALAADPDGLAEPIRLLEERRHWMRPEQQPSAEAEAEQRAQLIPLMETILQQDELIARALGERQGQLLEALHAIRQARVSREYQPDEGAPDARFVDREG